MVKNKIRVSEIEWNTQRELLKNNPIPPIEQLIEACEQSKDIRTRALFIILYLTAARISEVVKILKIKDIVRNINKKGRDFFLITIPNKKNPHRNFKQIPVMIDNNKQFIDMLKEYTNTLNEEDILFNITRQRASTLLHKEFGVNAHYIRHIRLTHLVTIHDFNDQELVSFAGWTDSQPATTYVALRYSNLIKKL